MSAYDHRKVEKKWREKWEKENLYRTPEDSSIGPTSEDSGKKKFYALDMFPYPSGDGLHVGHPKGYIATDVYTRMKRMQGYQVLHPMGWDAFGLPAENYAIKNKIHPRVAVEKNIARFKEQLSLLGFNYDWTRELNTTDPEYYRWTQWVFLRLLGKGLAYESNEPINWCPSCKTGLANEDLDGDSCERCGTKVEKRPVRQWVLKITDYADRLLSGLEKLDWPESIKESQRNWIGKSEGAEIDFPIKDYDKKITIFTTRPDTLFGATYIVLSPEHPLVQELKPSINNWDEVIYYVKIALAKQDIDRTAEGKEKTGVALKGISAVNPGTGENIPVWIADYVLPHYGTGAIMAVPAHDERDLRFWKKYREQLGKFSAVIYPDGAELEIPQIIETAAAYTREGILRNSAEFNGMESGRARIEISKKYGRLKTAYHLQDWIFSRQRYWGEPIPVIHCPACGVVPVPEKDLPVTLPDVATYEPTGTEESPLAGISEWVNVECPRCGGKGKRETNTMPQWAGSCWYYLRYLDPKNNTELVNREKEKYWLPVDLYVGGAEHATRHLIYARFWHKFLYDIGVVHTEEPFTRLQSVGLVLAEDGKKMSKRWGNVINPDDIVERFGADTLRMYEMFMGPFSQSIAWSTDNMVGVRRFLERVWEYVTDGSVSLGADESSDEQKVLLHKTVKKVGDDIESMRFNTAISALMIYLNETKSRKPSRQSIEAYLKLLAPFVPHIADELWEEMGHTKSIHLESWPMAEPRYFKAGSVTIPVQVDGKVRDVMIFDSLPTKEEVGKKVKQSEKILRFIGDKKIVREVYVEGKIYSLVLENLTEGS